MLAAMILWVPFMLILVGKEDMFGGIYSSDVETYTIIGLVVILLLRLVLGSLIDKKKAKPESE
jgi:hypothetical protein